MNTEEKMAQLAELNDKFCLTGLNRDGARYAVITDEQRAELEAIDEEFEPIFDELRERIGALEAEIKEEVIARGESVKAAGFHLPDNLRACERVPDIPITAEALLADEWIRIPEDDGIYEHWLSSDEDDVYVAVLLRGEEGGVFVHYGEQTYQYIEMPGVTTMRQLGELVGYLGGEA